MHPQSSQVCRNCGTQITNRDLPRCEQCNYPCGLTAGTPEPQPVPESRYKWLGRKTDQDNDKLVVGWLITFLGDSQIVYDLYASENLIGRDSDFSDADLPIFHDPKVSKRHAVITCLVDEDRMFSFQIQDAGSMNGTKLEGSLLGKEVHDLYDGNTIQLADSRFIFKSVYDAYNHRDALDKAFKQTIW